MALNPVSGGTAFKLTEPRIVCFERHQDFKNRVVGGELNPHFAPSVIPLLKKTAWEGIDQLIAENQGPSPGSFQSLIHRIDPDHAATAQQILLPPLQDRRGFHDRVTCSQPPQPSKVFQDGARQMAAAGTDLDHGNPPPSQRSCPLPDPSRDRHAEALVQRR